MLLSSSSHLAGQEEKGWKSSPATFLECRPSSRAAPWHVRNSTGHKSHQNASHSFNHITESAVDGTGRQQLGQDWEISNIRRFARVSSFPMGVARCRLVPMSVLIRDWAPIQGCTRASKYIQYFPKRWAVCHRNLQEWWWSPLWLYQSQLSRTHNVCNGPPPSSPTLHVTVTPCTLHVAALCHNVCAMWCAPLCDVHYLPLSVCVVPSEAVYSAVLSSFVCSGVVLCGLMLYCIAGW